MTTPTAVADTQTLAGIPADQDAQAIRAVPAWLSWTLIALGIAMLAIQSLILLSYLGVVSATELLQMPASTFAFGIAAWTASRLARSGAPEAAKYLGWASIAVTVVGLLVHTFR